jgi:hypothetical protein
LAALLGDYAKLIAPTFLAMIFNGAKFLANLFFMFLNIKRLAATNSLSIGGHRHLR